MKRLRWLTSLAIGLAALVAVALVAERKYPAGPKDIVVLTVDAETTWQAVEDQLDGSLQPWVLKHWAWRAKKDNRQPHPGHYRLRHKESTLVMYRRVTLGYEDAIRVRLRGYQSTDAALEDIASHFPHEKSAFIEALQDFPDLVLMPNTYDMYWSSSPTKVFQRLAREYDSFWDESRKMKAMALSLKPSEVVVLASLVQAESKILSDMATVASLYLTRLARGMKLESDPTVIFAVMDREPGHEKIRRVSRAMTKLDHPYNTYQINGLPPKPLATVDSHIIDLVLDARPGEYLFMCADPDRPGHHNFAKTHGGHILNKLKYVAWLNGLGIYR